MFRSFEPSVKDKFSELQQQKSNIGDRHRKLQKQFSGLQDEHQCSREMMQDFTMHDDETSAKVQEVLEQKQALAKSIQEMTQNIQQLEGMCANYQQTERDLRMQVKKIRVCKGR